MKPGRTGNETSFRYLAGIVLTSLLLLCLAPSARAAKTATSATLTIIADDRYDLYINGTMLPQASCYTNGPFYCKSSSTTYNIIGYLLCGSTNTLATTNYDVPSGRMDESYIMTVKYDDGSVD